MRGAGAGTQPYASDAVSDTAAFSIQLTFRYKGTVSDRTASGGTGNRPLFGLSPG